MFGGCTYFLNKALDKVYNPVNRKKKIQHSFLLALSFQKIWSTLINEPLYDTGYVLIIYKVILVLK